MGFLDDLPELNDDRPRRRPGPPPGPPECVPFVRVRCPACGSADCPVYNSNSVPVRYHKCNACGRLFKSIETNYHPGDPDV